MAESVVWKVRREREKAVPLSDCDMAFRLTLSILCFRVVGLLRLLEDDRCCKVLARENTVEAMNRLHTFAKKIKKHCCYFVNIYFF